MSSRRGSLTRLEDVQYQEKRPSAVQLDGDEAPSEIICPTCLQSLRSRSRSKSITRKKSPGKKVARKVAMRQRSKSGGKSRRNKKRSMKKSNQKAVLIKASKSRRKRSSIKSIPKQKRHSLRSRAVVR
ncbi:6-mannosyltransferase,Probable Dol-P-Man:Man(7)GlcNAc(2)-PP-Dol alpha-1 [Trichinella spiralis]|uniref:6-mannosyltransferase,Probable Dol-P-Man:Man(7)GlcNAc(2)-PP-Dol alpha-1 n=1 Tax=Trichinella spiralis TaxID=6334 RepID=A0ABR3KBW1_TRISP